MSILKRISLGGIEVDTAGSSSLLSLIESSISTGSKLKITYLNASCFNLLYNNKELAKAINKFDVIHPDGIGIFLAAIFLKGRRVLEQRLTGSDLYPLLWEKCIKNGSSIYFFGHDDDTLSKIKNNIPALKIAGIQNGYSFSDQTVVENINESKADILVIGLGYPSQEKWVLRNFHQLNTKVMICVGEGIKVFAGSKKRGPRFLQALGLEWLVRLVLNPFKYFKRYVIGIPLFLYRIIIIKIRNLA